MSELELIDISSLLLSCRFLEDGTFDVHHEGSSVSDGVVLYLDEDATTQIAIANLTHAGTSYRTSALTVKEDGTLSAWERDDAGVYSPDLPAATDEVVLHVAIVAVEYDDALSPDQQAAFLPKSGYAQIRVRKRNKGDKPFI